MRTVYYIYRDVKPGTPTSHPVGKSFTGDHFDKKSHAEDFVKVANNCCFPGTSYGIHAQDESNELPDLNEQHDPHCTCNDCINDLITANF